MISEPIAPLLLCLIGSDEIRLVAPNSIGVAIRWPPLITTSPAYQLYRAMPPGPTVWLGLKPTFFPSLFARCRRPVAGANRPDSKVAPG